jgi:hypothetical protein
MVSRLNDVSTRAIICGVPDERKAWTVKQTVDGPVDTCFYHATTSGNFAFP